MINVSIKKRLKITLWALISNIALILIAIAADADLEALGKCLAWTNIPIIMFIIGETNRPSAPPIEQSEK